MISKIIELIEDRHFYSGFNVLGYNSATDGRKIIMNLDYNKSAIPTNKPLWYMAQWWTPYNLYNCNYLTQDGYHSYITKSRTIRINPSDSGYLFIELLGSEEYFGIPRKSLSESWPHALIEQTFRRSIKLSKMKNLIINLEVNIEKCIDKNKDLFDPSIHAAQLLWYFTLTNKVNELTNEDGVNDDYLWFGVPIFDSRFDFLKQNANIDQGSVGTTNKLIYTMDSRSYLNEKIEFGKTYNINIDILPYLKEAFKYAMNNNALKNCKSENMEITYMNFGWELPGMYDVSSTIRNISAKAILK